RNLEKESARQRQEMHIINEILDVNEVDFECFIKNANADMEFCREILREGRGFAEADLRKMHISLHSLKEHSRSLNLSELIEFIGKTEDYLSACMENNFKYDRERILADIDLIAEKLALYEDIAFSKLKIAGRTAKNESEYDFYKNKVEHLNRVRTTDVIEKKRKDFSRIMNTLNEHILKVGKDRIQKV
ncbi:MAG: hypothetical protein HQK54_14700, partial [Oligoflexales bacterium]|nr:hypothetical protein [Oligoflexales bacterium]